MAPLGSPRALGANERISIGIIGAGGRGNYLLGEIHRAEGEMGVAVTAICDVWKTNREATAKKVQGWSGRAPFTTARYREILERKDIDAVVIATTDHAHCLILPEAIRAGKDAYCEKPMAYRISEAKEALKAVRETGRIVQIGTQRRSEGTFAAAADIVKSGVLGTVSRVTMEINFNHARWYRGYGDVREQDVDWKQFLMDRPPRPFDPFRFRCWHLFRDWTIGLSGLWMSHYIDVVNWIMDDPFPSSAVAHGGVYVWKDGRETEDTFMALLEYPKGFLATWGMGLGNESAPRFTIHGTNGTLDCEKWVLSGAGGAGSKRIKEEVKVKPKPSVNHVKNWLECMRTRLTPNADISAGFSHAVATIMASQALWKGKRIVWDREKEEAREA
ncbi:MAG: Gfo/Idh/MocA family oxidoreductase [Planctomycetes bacterium]|nr:Gfo/Idh/MocA family oxidoreductase [Planctomycetota bacterium]